MDKISNRIIIWRADSGSIIYDASTWEKEQAAYLLMVEEMNRLKYYAHDLEEHHAEYLEKALAGDATAAYKLLSTRRHYEYESWHQEELINPIEMRALHKAIKEIKSESSKKRQKGRPAEGSDPTRRRVGGAKPARAVDEAGRKRRPSAKAENEDSGKNRRRRA